ncbi:ribosome biogenesis protein SLX9-domain-containing protein [Chytriomyces sp. MP71]|nr:ribosome biogenesis protein SLX9-domain-containing protein [Chytriomyces sp. MP71]
MPRAEKRVTHRAHIKVASRSGTVSKSFGSSLAAANPNDHLTIASSKKAKRTQRHEVWLEKMSGMYSARANADKRKKQKDLFGVAADLEGISMALDLETVRVEESQDEATTEGRKEAVSNVVEKKKPKSQSARRQESVNEMLRLQSIMAHRAFKQNPLETIRTHLKNTI